MLEGCWEAWVEVWQVLGLGCLVCFLGLSPQSVTCQEHKCLVLPSPQRGYLNHLVCLVCLIWVTVVVVVGRWVGDDSQTCSPSRPSRYLQVSGSLQNSSSHTPSSGDLALP